MSQKCPNCTNKIQDNVKFCPNCGYELNEDLSQNDFEFTDDFSFTAKTDFSDDFNYNDSDDATGNDFSYENLDESAGNDFDYDDSLNVDDFSDESTMENDFTKDDFNYNDFAINKKSKSDDDINGDFIDELSEDFPTKSDKTTHTGEDIDISGDFTFEEMGSSSTDLFEVDDDESVSFDESDFSFADDFDSSLNDGEMNDNQSRDNHENAGDFTFEEMDSSSTDLFEVDDDESVSFDDSDFSFADDFDAFSSYDDTKENNLKDNTRETDDFTFDDFDFTEDTANNDLSDLNESEDSDNMQHTLDNDMSIDEYLDFEDSSPEDASANDDINFLDESLKDDMAVDDYTISEDKEPLKSREDNESFSDDFTSDDFDFAGEWADDSPKKDTTGYDYTNSNIDEKYHDDGSFIEISDSYNDNKNYSENMSDEMGPDKDNIYEDLTGKRSNGDIYNDSTTKNGEEYEYSDDFIIDNYDSSIHQSNEESDNEHYTSLTDMIMANKTAILIIIIVLLVLFIIMEHL